MFNKFMGGLIKMTKRLKILQDSLKKKNNKFIVVCMCAPIARGLRGPFCGASPGSSLWASVGVFSAAALSAWF